MTMSPVTLGEVRRRYAPALAAADQDAQVVDREGDDPERGLRSPPSKKPAATMIMGASAAEGAMRSSISRVFLR